jgi:hypothetical protein
MLVPLDLSVGVSVNVLDVKAQGLDVSDLLSVEGLGPNQLGKPQRGGVGWVRVNLRNAVNDFDHQKNDWHINLQKVPSCYGRLDTPPKNSTLPFGLLRTRQSGGLVLSGLAFAFTLVTG